MMNVDLLTLEISFIIVKRYVKVYATFFCVTLLFDFHMINFRLPFSYDYVLHLYTFLFSKQLFY